LLASLHLEDYFDQTLNQLAYDMRFTPKTRAGDITLRELASTLERPNGVYAFYDQAADGVCLYVGKASSQSYIARIAMHFDPREESWMNQFVRKLRDTNFPGAYDSAHNQGLEQYIIFLGLLFAEGAEDNSLRSQRINALESILRTHLAPRLNSRRGKYDGCSSVGSLLPVAPGA
jgi:mRNA deadenylase 3'-5' endonuclease subunit Ccr4